MYPRYALTSCILLPMLFEAQAQGFGNGRRGTLQFPHPVVLGQDPRPAQFTYPEWQTG